VIIWYVTEGGEATFTALMEGNDGYGLILGLGENLRYFFNMANFG